MSTKNIQVAIVALILVAAATVAYVVWYPRPYYRYGEGHVWLTYQGGPNACWNGLLRAPVFEFKVPPFTFARYWRPSPEQIRSKLEHQTNLNLSENQILYIIHSCVSCAQQNDNTQY